MTTNLKNILVSGTGKLGVPLMQEIENDERYELIPFAISEDPGNSKTIQIENAPGVKNVTLVRPDERAEILPEIYNKYSPLILMDVVPKNVAQGNIDFFSRFGNVPLIAMSSGIKDKSKSHNTLFLPNSCLEIIAWEQFIAELDENTFNKNYSLKIIESYPKTELGVSETSRKMVSHFNRIGLPFEEKQIAPIRSESEYLTLGIPSMFYENHEFRQYTISSNEIDDMRLKIFFSRAEDFFEGNVLFKKLFFEEVKPKKHRNYEERMLFWGNNKLRNTPYRTFMFGIQLILTDTQTRVEISHSIFGHQPYVDGAINYALPFMQEKCRNGLTGENFSSLDLYNHVMKN